MAQLMLLPLAVSCFSKIQIGFTFLVPADPGSPGKRAVKRVCAYTVYYIIFYYMITYHHMHDRRLVHPYYRIMCHRIVD